MLGCPENSEAAVFYFTYIHQVSGDDPQAVLRSQLEFWPKALSCLIEEQSHYRCAPDKWKVMR
jgi:hypothetical protein